MVYRLLRDCALPHEYSARHCRRQVVNHFHCSRRATGVTAGVQDRRVTQHRELRPPALATAGIRARRAMFTSRVSTVDGLLHSSPRTPACLSSDSSRSPVPFRWPGSVASVARRGPRAVVSDDKSLAPAGGSDAAGLRVFRSPGPIVVESPEQDLL